MVGAPKFNYNNVLVILQTPKQYPGLSDYDKKNFIKYDFPGAGQPTSVYCVQNSAILNQFECLMFYPSGLPNFVYTVNFSYSYAGDSGFLPVQINPLQSTFRTRSLA